MRSVWKDLAKSTAVSIGISMTIFCLSGIIFDMIYGGTFSLEHYQFTKMVVGCMIVGLGFGIPTIIYKRDDFPMPIRAIIHMGTGCIIYTIVAYSVGWMGGTKSTLNMIAAAMIQFAVAFLIWFLFMLHYRNEARQINKRIQEMK